MSRASPAREYARRKAAATGGAWKLVLVVFVGLVGGLSAIAYMNERAAVPAAPSRTTAGRPLPPGYVSRDGQTITKELSDEMDESNRQAVAKMMAKGMSEAEARAFVRTFRRIVRAAVELWGDADAPGAREAVVKITASGGYAWVDLVDATDEQIRAALVAARK